MKDLKLLELSPVELIQINGGQTDDPYATGVSHGQLVGKMVRNFLTLNGIWRLAAFL